MRIIPFLVFVVVGYLLYQVLRRSHSNQRPVGRDDRQQEVEKMVRCHHCGLHVPEREALWQDGRPYCSEEHRRSHDST